MTNDLVRVRLDSGVETNLSRVHAETIGATVLDEPAFDGSQPRPDTRNGEPIVAKDRTSVDQKAAEKKGAVEKSAPTTKE